MNALVSANNEFQSARIPYSKFCSALVFSMLAWVYCDQALFSLEISPSTLCTKSRNASLALYGSAFVKISAGCFAAAQAVADDLQYQGHLTASEHSQY